MSVSTSCRRPIFDRNGISAKNVHLLRPVWPDFRNFLVTNFITTVAQMLSDFLGSCENHPFLSQTGEAAFLATFWKNVGFFLFMTSFTFSCSILITDWLRLVLHVFAVEIIVRASLSSNSFKLLFTSSMRGCSTYLKWLFWLFSFGLWTFIELLFYSWLKISLSWLFSTWSNYWVLSSWKSYNYKYKKLEE